MAAQRISQFGLRRVIALTAPRLRVHHAGCLVQRRLTSHDEASKIIVKQRLRRPVSPHISIYKPQITWLASSLGRITGITLSGSLYVFGIAYLFSAYTGWHLDTASMVEAISTWPDAVKVSLKAFFAFPFFFHCLNGLRHLGWDLRLGLKNQQVIRTGWTVVTLTVVSSLYYTFLV